MKKMILAIMLISLSAKSADLISALIEIESGGNVSAIGDKGRAKGCLQIWDCVLNDVNRIYKKNYTKEDCFNKERSVEICRLYLLHYGKVYERKTGKKATAEVLAQIWNGGPNGWKKKSTKGYWSKVKKEIVQ